MAGYGAPRHQATKRSSTKHPCVYWDSKRQKYKVEAWVNDKRTYLGRYDTLIEAEQSLKGVI